MDYFIADTHFYHENIIKYENRPFRDAEHMNAELIKRWNNTVKKSDRVFLLGDVGFANKAKVSEIIQQLNGTKILVMGNHDSKNIKYYQDMGFKEVYKYPIVYKEFFILSHEPPTYFNENCPYFYIYGHVHSTDMYKTVTKNSACVSVERWDYKPVSMDTLMGLAKLA